MKKILFLYNRNDGHIITGGQKYENDLFKGLQENTTFKTERICINDIKGFVSKLFSPLRNLRLINRLDIYDLIIFNSVEGYYLFLLGCILRFVKGKKILIIHHHFIYMSFNGIRRGIYYLLEKFFLKSANIIITPSPYIESLCKTKFQGKEIRLWPIPFSANSDNIEKFPKKGELLYVGTVEARKGLIYLLESLRYLRKKGLSYNLTIVGKVIEDNYKKLLDNVIAKYNLNVTFTGFIDLKEKNLIVSNSDVFVFPSQLEGYGMVLCEAMCEGLPVVCFNNTAMPYVVINNQNGIIVSNKDSVAFAEAIEHIVENRNLRSLLSAGARKYSKDLINLEDFRELTNREIREILYSSYN